jgi:hypothetical protein
VIAPTFAGTTLDTPTLGGEVAGGLARAGHVIVDVGGDDVGATALGRYRDLLATRTFELWYVVNANRNLTQTAGEALEIMRQIEAVTGLAVTGIINNTHLQDETTTDTVRAGERFGQAVADEAGVPLVCVTVPVGLDGDGLTTPVDLRYPTTIYVRPPW